MIVMEREPDIWEQAAQAILSGDYGHREFMLMVGALREWADQPDASSTIKAAAKVLSDLRKIVATDPKARNSVIARKLNLSKSPDRFWRDFCLAIAVRSLMAEGDTLEVASAKIAEKTGWSDSHVEDCYEAHKFGARVKSDRLDYFLEAANKPD